MIPVVQLAAPAVWVIFSAWVLSLEYLEYPLGNRGMLFRDVRVEVARHRGEAMGFGLAVTLLTLIPVVNFLAMPVAVSGATKLCLERFRG